MNRRMDFSCAVDGVFEASEPLGASVSSHWPCPTCGVLCPKVYLRAPAIGKIDRGTFVTDFRGGAPGNPQRVTLTRDEVERRLAYEPPAPFADDHGLAGRLSDRFDQLAAKEAAGELPPSREVTQAERDTLAKVLKQTP